MSTIKVIHWDPDTDGEFNEQAMYNKLTALGYQVNRYIYPPGTFFPEHDHSMDKIDAVLAGRFKMTLHRESVILEAGDCLEIPRGIMHSAEVIGNKPVVSLDAIKID